MKTERESGSIYTIGHSTHDLDHFIRLLTLHRIDRIVDVRSTPYSKWQPQYNRESFAATLRGFGADYQFMGAELGARSDDRTCYENGKVRYGRLSSRSRFQSAIKQLQNDGLTVRIALMCAEQEPLECHRTILVAKALERSGTPVVHILADGSIETQSDAMIRLLKLLKMPEMDLFHTTEEIIEDAYLIQEQKIAYVDRDLDSREPALGAFR